MLPRRKGGLFLPLDVNFMDDPRIVRVGRDAAWLYLAMLLACKRLASDGRIWEVQLERLHVPQWQKHLARLLEVELVWKVGDDEYAVAGWFHHNDPVRVVEERRRKDRDRKAGRGPNGVGSESGAESAPSRGVEGSEAEGSEVAIPCAHGAEAPHLCAFCRRGSMAVAQ